MVIVVEGEKARDAAAKMFTRSAVVTWRGGCNNTSTGDWDLLAGKDVFLWPDNDPDGLKAMNKIAEKLKSSRKVRLGKVSHLPPKSDAADNLSRSAVGKVFEDAVDITNAITGRLSFDELRDQNEKLNKRLPFGWDTVDDRVQLPQSGVVIVEGRTKHGKSAFTVALTNNMLKAGHTIKYFSYEIPASRVVARYARSDNPDLTLDNVYDSEEMEAYKKSLNERLFVYDQSKQYSLSELVEELDKDENNGACIVIDYTQIVPLDGGDRHIATKKLIDSIRVVAHRRGFLVLLLSQLTKNYADPLQDTPRYAQDLHFGAEMVIRIWYKDQEPPHPLYEQTEGNYTVHILYNRDGPAGMRFGFHFDRGAALTPNGAVDLEYRMPPKRSAKTDLQQLADILRQGMGTF